MRRFEKRLSDPFIRKSTLAFLTRGETRAVQCVAAQLHFGMVRSFREDKIDHIRATWKEVADWAGISYSSVKRAVIRLRELGWVKELPGHRIIFNYKRSCPVEKAQIEPSHNIELETLREGCTHPSESNPSDPSENSPSGEDVLDQTSRIKKSRMSPDQREALSILAALPGIHRAGAARAVKTGGPNLVARVQKILSAIDAMPSKPWRPAGLIIAAICRPELGQKLIRDYGSNRIPDHAQRSVPKNFVVPTSLSRFEDIRNTLRGWLDLVDLSDPEDLNWIIKTAGERGWGLDELRTLPELRQAFSQRP
jgi:hypothetical protein